MKYIDRRCDFEVINYNEWIDFVGLRRGKNRYIPFAPLKCDFEKFTCEAHRKYPARGKINFQKRA